MLLLQIKNLFTRAGGKHGVRKILENADTVGKQKRWLTKQERPRDIHKNNGSTAF